MNAKAETEITKWKNSRDDASLPWWRRREYPAFGYHYDVGPSWLHSVLIEDALEGNEKPSLAKRIRGNLTITTEAFVAKLREELKLNTITFSPHQKEGANGSYAFANQTTFASADLHGIGKWGDINLVTSDKELFERAIVMSHEFIIPDPPESGPVFTLAKTRDGYEIIRIGTAGVQIERDNYNENVIEAYDHIVADLNTSTPCGRLVILSGEPGTGKTFLIRSLLTAVPKATFILIPPGMVRDLGNPDILPSLTNAKQELDGPVVLLAEDADMCLVKREGDNMSTVQAVLNLGDGILGSMLDIRMLISTNAGKFEMDKAALRKGRLCRQLEVTRIPIEKASGKVLRLFKDDDSRASAEKLMEKNALRPSATNKDDARTGFGNGDQVNKNGITLADMYSYARDLGWRPPPTKAKDPNGVEKWDAPPPV